jgi:quercetin dioxygenase-like cupin family protein
MITVEHAPGGSSAIHRHNAHSFVYVLEGSVVMQLKGGQQVTLTPGQTFYKAPTMFMSLTGTQAVPSRRNSWWS